jgi:hypothetical protein
MDWALGLLSLKVFIVQGDRFLVAFKQSITGSRDLDFLIFVFAGLAFLVFSLAKRLPSLIKYLVKTYREISRTIKN